MTHGKHANKMLHTQVIVCHDSLYLVELCQVSGVQSFVSEDSVYTEVLGWPEALLCTIYIENMSKILGYLNLITAER